MYCWVASALISSVSIREQRETERNAVTICSLSRNSEFTGVSFAQVDFPFDQVPANIRLKLLEDWDSIVLQKFVGHYWAMPLIATAALAPQEAKRCGHREGLLGRTATRCAVESLVMAVR